MDKPIKPTNLMPRSFGGVKNNWSASMQSSGYEDGVPAIYGGDNLNYQLDATGKELDYCEKFADFLNAIPIGKTITVDNNNKLVYADLVTDTSGKANISLNNLNSDGKAKIAIKQYLITETYILNDVVMAIVDNEVSLFRSLVNNNVGNAITNETYWEKVELGGGASRNIGEIVTSTIPLEDAGLHLLDGALLQYGSYKAFVDYIEGLVSDYPDLFETEANWQSAVTQYGVCGKFVYDSINNTVRLPKYSNKIYTQSINNSASVVGTGAMLGLTSGTNYFGLVQADSPIAGVFHSDIKSTVINAGSSAGIAANKIGSNGAAYGVSKDATKSGLVADLANITTSLDGYYYIVVATSTKTEIEVDIDEIATDLNGKADTDLTNTTNTGYIKMAGASMPSNTYEDLTLGASGTTYTAPANGWFALSKSATGSQQWIKMINMSNGMTIQTDAYTSQDASFFIPVLKNDVIFVNYDFAGTTYFFRFIYAKGSESEA